MANNKKRRAYPRWLNLFLYNNCFSDGDNTHLGIKFRNVYYCITHSRNNGFEIPKKYLKMKDISKKTEYLKECTSTPTIIHLTNMKINEKIIVDFILNKINNEL